MTRPLYMTSKELLDNFGKGPKGHRVIPSDTVQFLLANPSSTQLDILMKTGLIAEVPIFTRPKRREITIQIFDEIPSPTQLIDIRINWDDLSSD